MGRVWQALGMALAMLTMTMAGCIGVEDGLLEAQSTDDVDDVLGQILELREDEGFEIDTPVQVVLVGFDEDAATALDERLDNEQVLHAAMSYPRDFPPGTAEPVDQDDMIVPVTPNATYQVEHLDDALADRFFETVRDNRIPGTDSKYDANAAEDELARILPEDGIQLDEDTPTFVILHAQDRLPGDHAWRFTYPNGHLEPVRAFGERTPILAYDASAQTDPYVVGPGGGNDVADYNFPFEPDASSVDTLEELVLDATHYRLAKGSIYPVSMQPCHNVTFLLAVHQSALSPMVPGGQDPEEWVDVDEQIAVFENATGDPVNVNFETLMLPQDDPVLDATTRRAAGAQESGVFLDTMRWYLSENWENYVDASDECEDYLSLLLFADATSEPGRAFSGIGMYDVNTDRRITFSVVTDAYRLENEHDGPLDEMLGYDEQREPDYVNRLFSHETGHVLGLHHPQHLIRADDEPSDVNSAFESIWSSMSYQVSDRIIDFGTVDNAQFERNRAGYIIQQAQQLDLEDTPEFDAALERLAAYDWEGAYDVLHETVHEEMEGSQATAKGYEAGGHHWHD